MTHPRSHVITNLHHSHPLKRERGLKSPNLSYKVRIYTIIDTQKVLMLKSITLKETQLANNS